MVVATRDLAGAGSLKGIFEVVMELFIGEVSRLYATSDQVCSRTWLRLKVVNECPESAANLVSHHRISNSPADRIRHVDCATVRGTRHEANSQRPTLTASSW
jgi:hypothetical protein